MGNFSSCFKAMLHELTLSHPVFAATDRTQDTLPARQMMDFQAIDTGVASLYFASGRFPLYAVCHHEN
jgi:hypothetical protein